MGYQTEWTPADASVALPCGKCNEDGGIEYREWESSCGGYEEYRYRCTKCGHTWWPKGPTHD